MIYVVFCLGAELGFPREVRAFTDRDLAWDYEEWLIENYTEGPVMFLEREANDWSLTPLS